LRTRQALTEEQRQKAEALWAEGSPASEVAAAVGWTTRQLQGAKEAKQLSLPRRQQGVGRKQDSNRDLTKRELQAATSGIRKNWTEFERLNRKVGPGRVLLDSQIKDHAPRFPRTYSMQIFEGVVNG
jgi:hypothetical protein